MAGILRTVYGPGGYDQTKPGNNVVSEEWVDVPDAPAPDPPLAPAETVEQRDALARAFEKAFPGAKPDDIAVLVAEITAIMGEGGVG